MRSGGVRASGDEVLVDIRLVPRASRNEILGWDGSGRLRVRVTAPPVEGAANGALLRFLAGELGLPSGKLRVCRGMTSRQKTVAVRGTTLDAVKRALGEPGEP